MKKNHLTPNIWVRLPQEDLDDLDYIVSQKPGNRSDHSRQAIKEYNARMLATLRAEQTADKQATQA